MTGSTVDTIWHNASIRTLDPNDPAAQALAVAGGRIVAVGNNADVLALSTPGTRIHDMHGKVMMPGLIDSHLHIGMGGIRDLFEVYSGFSASISRLLEQVRERAGAIPPGEWITGGVWHMAQLQDELAQRGKTARALLDEYAPENPVMLRDATYHTNWVNTPALNQCGISVQTPDPNGGSVGRDNTGSPDGLLYETASAPVLSAAAPNGKQMMQAVRYVQNTLHQLGITGCKDAATDLPLLQSVAALDDAGELQLDITTHLARRPLGSDETVPIDELVRRRDTYRRTHLHTQYVKLFLDGVAPTKTAAFLEPYLGCGCQQGFNPDAQLLYTPDELARELIHLDAAGFTVKMHAVGDRAVQAGLDGIAAARRAGNKAVLRHEIAHTTFVAPDDFGRFAELDAIAEVSPRLWFPNPITAGQYRILGQQRTNRCHPIRQLLDSGATLIYGSDWPAAAVDADPWIGLAGMISRRHPTGLFDGALGESEAITLDQALPMFTRNAARALSVGDRCGMLRRGFNANLLILDQDPAEIENAELARLRPRQTIFEGEVVFESDKH